MVQCCHVTGETETAHRLCAVTHITRVPRWPLQKKKKEEEEEEEKKKVDKVVGLD